MIYDTKSTRAVFFLASFFSFFFAFAQEKGSAGLIPEDAQGKRTASGELYDMNKMTAAHKNYEFGSTIKITRIDNNRSVVVRVNDRGPYQKGRVVNLSRIAAREIGLTEGEVPVKVELIQNANINEDISTPKPKPIPESADRRTVKLQKAKKVQPKIVAENSERKTVAAAPKPVEPIAKVATEKKSEKSIPVSAETATDALYKINVSKQNRTGYGIQIAAMSDMKHILRRVAQVQENVSKNILIATEKKGTGKLIYKLIIGPFPDANSAELFKKSITKKKISGFIVNLATMETATGN